MRTIVGVATVKRGGTWWGEVIAIIQSRYIITIHKQHAENHVYSPLPPLQPTTSLIHKTHPNSPPNHTHPPCKPHPPFPKIHAHLVPLPRPQIQVLLHTIITSLLLYGALYLPRIIHLILNTRYYLLVNFSRHFWQRTPYTVQFTLYTVLCTLYSV